MTEGDINAGSVSMKFKADGADVIEKKFSSLQTMAEKFQKTMQMAATISIREDDPFGGLRPPKRPDFEALRAQGERRRQEAEEAERRRRSGAGGAVGMMADAIENGTPLASNFHVDLAAQQQRRAPPRGKKGKESIDWLKPAEVFDPTAFSPLIEWIDINNDLIKSEDKKAKSFREKWGETKKVFDDQSFVLQLATKHWKLFTGAFIGSFYTVAKLSPLFASYMSEFGGIIGYFYDTILIPFTPLVEGILNTLWSLTDWVADQPEWLQAMIGAVAIGIPLLVGFASAVIGVLQAWGFLVEIGVIAWLSDLAAGAAAAIAAVVGWPAVLIAAAVAIALVVAHWLGLDDKIIASVKNWGVKIKEWYVQTKADIEEAGGLWPWLQEKAKNALDTIKGYIQTAWDKLTSFSVSGVWTSVTNKAEKFISVLSGDAEVTGSRMTGGPITQDGLYMLHQGETIIPASMSRNGSAVVNVSVTNTISGSNMNERDLSYYISKIVTQEVKKALGGSMR